MLEQTGRVTFEPRLPYPDAKSIAERLGRKSVAVNIFNVFHVGSPSQELIGQFGIFDLRTEEDTWGNIEISGGESNNSIDNALAGLGPNPKYLLSPTETKSKYTTVGNRYFDSLEKAYHDIRGVDQTFSGDWVLAIADGRATIPSLDLPGLTPSEQSKLTKSALIFCLNAHRDMYQAYFIAKILDLYTFDKSAASLGHIGGVNHSALPEILRRNYGLSVEEKNIGGVKPDDLTEALEEIIPVEEAINMINRTDRKNLNFKGRELAQKLIPHVQKLKGLVR